MLRDFITYFFLVMIYFVHPLLGAEKDDSSLISRGEHQIQVINYGHKRPEVPMDIMQSNYYNAHHPDYVIRIEDLNKTLNKEINEDINREYNEWFNNEFNQRQAEYEYLNQYQNDYAPYNNDNSSNLIQQF